MKLQNFQPKRARIEIIPMIDTIFFLLVFFMIASLAMTTMKGIPVNLPKAASGKDRPMVKTVLTLTRTNRYYVDKKEVRFDQIYPELKARLAENPRLVGVINCDKAQTWGKGIELTNEAKSAGIELLTLATEPKVKRG